jgi:hypothetical protein
VIEAFFFPAPQVAAYLLAPAVAVHEFVLFSRPSPALCVLPPKVPDFGPPEGCDDKTGEHSRTVVITSLATSTGTITQMSVGYTVSDPEYVALDPLSQTRVLALPSV